MYNTAPLSLGRLEGGNVAYLAFCHQCGDNGSIEGEGALSILLVPYGHDEFRGPSCCLHHTDRVSNVFHIPGFIADCHLITITGLQLADYFHYFKADDYFLGYFHNMNTISYKKIIIVRLRCNQM